MNPTKAFAAPNATAPLGPFEIERRDPLPTDVQLEILYCGVCHTDIHIARNEWATTLYPCVPGHEIVGRVTHDLNTYLNLLKRDGTLTLVGVPEQPLPVAAFSLLFGRHQLAGSLIGGIAETQEMLNFCAEHGITSDIELIPIQKINEAYERMLKSDVKYRFVIDNSSLNN